jgi:hypothetical protein
VPSSRFDLSNTGGHATTFVAARWRRAHRDPRRGTSSTDIDADHGDRRIGCLIKNRNAASFKIVSLLDSRQGDRDLRNVGCSGGVDRDRLPIGLGRHGQIRCESDAIDFTANSRAGNRPGDVADRIARDLIPFAGETGSRRGYIAFDVELVAVARTEQALLERRAVRCHVVVRLAANSLTPCRRLDGSFARPIAGKPGKRPAFVLLRRRTDRQEKQADRQHGSLHLEYAALRKYP